MVKDTELEEVRHHQQPVPDEQESTDEFQSINVLTNYEELTRIKLYSQDQTLLVQKSTIFTGIQDQKFFYSAFPKIFPTGPGGLKEKRHHRHSLEA